VAAPIAAVRAVASALRQAPALAVRFAARVAPALPARPAARSEPRDSAATTRQAASQRRAPVCAAARLAPLARAEQARARVSAPRLAGALGPTAFAQAMAAFVVLAQAAALPQRMALAARV